MNIERIEYECFKVYVQYEVAMWRAKGISG